LINNPTLTAIRERRSANRFLSQPITDEQMDAILEAGRWAPSALNSQPWDFVVVTDPVLRSEMGAILRDVTWAWSGFAAAPAIIVVSVNPARDPVHFVEDGAIAAQNLCLAAHSVGLASSWAGVYRGDTRDRTAEKILRKLLLLPRAHRIIAVVPVGTPSHVSRGSRRPLAEMVHQNHFHPQTEPNLQAAPALAARSER
jgi:nitroreductase